MVLKTILLVPEPTLLCWAFMETMFRASLLLCMARLEVIPKIPCYMFVRQFIILIHTTKNQEYELAP